MQAKGKKLSTEELLSRAQAICSRQERCESDVRKRLMAWGAQGEQIQEILDALKEENYINHARFASLFASEKHRLNRWGVYKISYALTAKGIEKNLIEQAVEELDHEETEAMLIAMIERKARVTKAKDPNELKGKVVRFALSKGFPYGDVMKAIEKLSIG